MSTRDKLISDIEAFLAQYDMGPTLFGRMSVNDGALLIKLRRGSDITTERADRIYLFMRDHEKKVRRRASAHAA